MVTLSDEASKALYGACCKRGQDKGRLLRNAPKEPKARAAWYGAQIVCNPYKVSIAALLFMPDEERAIYREVEALFDQLKAMGARPELLDRDRRTLEALGVW